MVCASQIEDPWRIVGGTSVLSGASFSIVIIIVTIIIILIIRRIMGKNPGPPGALLLC